MQKNNKLSPMIKEIEAMSKCDWYSRGNQERYWTGSPWRALREMFQ